jgi:hypothetical protein
VSIQHDMETTCPKCGQDYRLHKGDEVECVCPTPPAVVAIIQHEQDARKAFVAHMESVGTTDVIWATQVGPVGYRNGVYAAMLAVEWDRFHAGYHAALAVAPATGDAAAVREAAEHLCDELGRILWQDAPLKWPEIKALRDKVRGMLTAIPLPAPKHGVCLRCGYLAVPPVCTKCYAPYTLPKEN